ncbi:dynein axonemal heavy chain 7-like [Physella acuta]|uniref:dynein axonemal heavy chain 7-like n=1 Tax=Physella acuta TaxID=109671 RepID=UPI0027DCC6CD|nr:dynein axonemal heavy chain 7-like [Physella acuta]
MDRYDKKMSKLTSYSTTSAVNSRGRMTRPFNLRGRSMRNDKECEGCTVLGVSQMDPVYFLPTVPMKRAKPIWMTDQPSFILSDNGVLPPDKPKPLALWSCPDKYETVDDDFEEKKPIRQRRSTKQGLLALQESRKRQEAFRKSLLSIVMQGKSGTTEPDDSEAGGQRLEKRTSFGQNEVDLFRYFYYVHNGVDVSDVQPLSEQVIKNIIGQLSPQLKKGQAKTIDKLCNEIKEDYILNTKKSILDFVLKDPRKQMEDPKELNAEMKELNVVPQPWHQNLINYKAKLHKNLCFVNPCIRQSNDIWYSEFSDLRFIYTKQFKERPEAISLSVFKEHCNASIASLKDKLTKNWLLKLQGMLMNEKNKRFAPPMEKYEKFDKFFQTLKTAMTLNLQTLVMDSLKEYMHMFKPRETSTEVLEHCGFVVNLLLTEEGTDIDFEPTLEDMVTGFLGMFDEIIKASHLIPRLERRMFPDLQLEVKYLQPVIPEDFIQELKEQVLEVLKTEFVPLQEFLNIFADLEFLISNQAKTDLESYLAESHPFDEMVEKFNYFQNITNHITCEIPKVETVGMFEINSHRVLENLAERTTAICDVLAEQMLDDHLESNKQ